MRPSQPETIIAMQGVVKKFGDFTALDHFDLTVNEGEVHGFLGPNGAGKSTAIRVILGLLRKTSGNVTLFGRDPWRDAVDLHKRLAYVPGDVNFWPNLTGGEIIDLLGDLRGGLDEKKRAELLTKFELDPTKKFRTYSKGNRQKVALVAALASNVDLYILDEPTSGLDPLMEATFQDCVKDLKAQQKTILLSSHILAEVEALCDQMTIIRTGKTVVTGTLEDLRRLHHTTMTVETHSPLKELAKMPGVTDITRTAGQVTFKVDPEHINTVIKFLSHHNVTGLVSNPPDLETLFLSQYSNKER